MIREVQKDKKIAIFPEGRISITGSLMKIYEGPGIKPYTCTSILLQIYSYRVSIPSHFLVPSKLSTFPVSYQLDLDL